MEVKGIKTSDFSGVLLPILTPMKQKRKDGDVAFKINTTLAIPSGRQNDVNIAAELEPEENEMIHLISPVKGLIVAPAAVIHGYEMDKQIIFMNVSNAQVRLEANTVMLVAKVVTLRPSKKETKKED
jgi:hypothetical protein